MRKRTKLPDDMRHVQSAIAEILGNDIAIYIAKNKKRINTQEYMIVFKYANEQLRQQLNMRAYNLLMHLYYVCEKGNKVHLTVEEITHSWRHGGIKNTYKAMRQLTKTNLILRRSDGFYINPQIAWNGWLGAWKLAIENLPMSDYVTIPISRVRNINRWQSTKNPESATA